MLILPYSLQYITVIDQPCNLSITLIIFLPASGSYIYIIPCTILVHIHTLRLQVVTNHHLVAVNQLFYSMCCQRGTSTQKSDYHITVKCLLCKPGKQAYPILTRILQQDGLQQGFQVGFDHSGQLQPARQSMPWVEPHQEVIDRYLHGSGLDSWKGAASTSRSTHIFVPSSIRQWKNSKGSSKPGGRNLDGNA